jgi:H+/Na+-translocating ferredoxin:NAD+ oxidoreductase subunit B
MVCPVDCIYVDEEWAATDEEMWNLIDLTTGGAA